MRIPSAYLVTLAAFVSFACGSKTQAPPMPSVASISPRAICAEQLTSTVSVSGMNFSAMAVANAPKGLHPGVSLNRTKDASGTAAPSQPVVLSGDAAVRWISSSSLVFTVTPDLMLAPGLYDVQVTGFDGKSASLTDALLALPRPKISASQPDLACGGRDTVFSLSGEGFLKGPDGSLPTVRVDASTALKVDSLGGCEPLAGSAGFQSCRTIQLKVPAGMISAGAHTLGVVNPSPAACKTNEAVTVQLIAAPSVASVAPDLLCPSDQTPAITVHGDGFLVSGGTSPRIRLGMLDIGGMASDCNAVSGIHESVMVCRTLTSTAPLAGITPGTFPVSVTNPAPADCPSTGSASVVIDSPPTVSDVPTDLICDSGTMRTIRIRGTNFAQVADPGHPGRQPQLDLVDVTSSTAVTIAMVATSSCTAVQGQTTEQRRTCTAMAARVPADSLIRGTYRVRVTNPAPLSCANREDKELVVFPPPNVDALVNPNICRDAADRTITVHGGDFLAFGAPGAYTAVPVVTVTQGTMVLIFNDPIPQHAFSVAPMGCSSIAHVTESAASCTGLSVVLPPNLALGMYSVAVTNPSNDADCPSMTTAPLMLTPPPMITSGVTPGQICLQGGMLMLNGMGFENGAVASLGGIAATDTSIANAGATVSATFGSLSGLTVNQTYPLQVRNPDGCLAISQQQVRLTQGSTPYFVDPPVAYNGINTRMTLYTSALPGRPLTVRIRRQGSGEQVLFPDASVTYDPAHPGRASVVIPMTTVAQPVPMGTYDVSIADSTGCENVLMGALSVTDRLALGLRDMAPSMGYFGDNPEVVLHARATATATPPLELFVQAPRVYLSPVPPGSAAAFPLRAVSFVDDGVPPADTSTIVTAVAPNAIAQMPIGTYDVVAVNPDGAVGILHSGYQVTAFPAPSISELVPGSIVAAARQSVQIQGGAFQLDPMCTTGCVRLTCRAPGAATPGAPVPAMLVSSMPTTISVLVDASSLALGSACVVRVTNQDGNFAELSALTIADPASGTVPIQFAQGSVMHTGRRAAAAAGASASAAARFIYAVGGDRGTDATALASVEAARVGPFGDLGAWFRVPVDLPQATTRAGIVHIGRFLYLVGGSVPGTGPVPTVSRAMILDPAQAPVMNDADFAVTANFSGGLMPGVYYYRVSAVRPSSDRGNPSGETLASDPLVITVPSSAGNRISARVSWQAQSGAASYRLYRTPNPNMFPGDERLICTFGAAATAYQDNNDPMNDVPPCMPDPNAAALPLGSTGVWHSQFPDNMNNLAPRAMAAPRASAGVVTALDRTNGGFHHIFAVGGTNGTSVLGSYEHLTVQENSPIAETVGADWVTGARTPTARSELGAVVADPTTASTTGTNVCVFALAGRTGATTATGLVEAALLPLQGAEVGPWSSTFVGPGPSDVPAMPAGLSAVLANSTLYVFGGTQMGGSVPGSLVEMRTLSGAGAACSTFTGPWNSLPLANLRPHALAGTAVVGGFVYILGGTVAQAGATCGDGTADLAAASCLVDGAVVGGQP